MAVLELEEKEAAHVRRRWRPQRREVWVKLWLTKRPLYGQYEQLLQELNTIASRSNRSSTRLIHDHFPSASRSISYSTATLYF
ncbi:hypothetical protein DPMN_106845 [Dreissena polymorpha]|uniref:Uncharacterized protein n=1 Tax=Dreissena polymorpha TaxID=45954 RepID=A0A9D4QJ23_DREPO|nr:hypothetical protein DPMN_106845 [Dreissena polymorpha]